MGAYKVLACMDYEIGPGILMKDIFVNVYVEADNEDQATDFTHKYLLGVYGCKNVRILQCEFDLNPKIDEL